MHCFPACSPLLAAVNIWLQDACVCAGKVGPEEGYATRRRMATVLGNMTDLPMTFVSTSTPRAPGFETECDLHACLEEARCVSCSWDPKSTAKLYEHRLQWSEFSLIVRGDTPSSARLYDALAYGARALLVHVLHFCPVVTKPRSYNLSSGPAGDTDHRVRRTLGHRAALPREGALAGPGVCAVRSIHHGRLARYPGRAATLQRPEAESHPRASEGRQLDHDRQPRGRQHCVRNRTLLLVSTRRPPLFLVWSVPLQRAQHAMPVVDHTLFGLELAMLQLARMFCQRMLCFHLSFHFCIPE